MAVGMLGTAAFHVVQFASGFDLFPGDRGDARLVAFLLEHWHQVFQGKAEWRSPSMFFPVEGTLGYADILLGYGIPHSIFRAAGLDILTAAEFTVILLNFLNYVACFILLRKILRFNLPASCVGAMFFAFNSPKLVQMGHLQLQPVVFLPLALIFIVLFVQKSASLSRMKAFGLLSLAALSLNLQLLTSFYPGWFFIFWSFLFLAVALAFRRTRVFLLALAKRFWRSLIGASVVFIVGLIPFLMVYLPVLRAGEWRTYDDVKRLIPQFWSLLTMNNRNYLWGTLSSAIKQSHPLDPELEIGIGLIPSVTWLGMLLGGIWLVRKYGGRRSRIESTRFGGAEGERRRNTLFLAATILSVTLVYVFGMKYWHDLSPWRLVYEVFPGAKGIRAVARYVIVLALPMAIAFSYLLHHSWQRIAERRNNLHRIALRVGVLALAAFGLFEQYGSHKFFNGFSKSVETAYLQNLADRLPENCSAFYVAVGPSGVRNQFEYQIDATLISHMRQVPTVNGYSGQLPRDWFLYEIKAPGYEGHVERWIKEQRLDGNVCRLEINDAVSVVKEIDDSGFFVGRQYLSFFGREPDAQGFKHWTGMLGGCRNNGRSDSDPACDRVNVFLSLLRSEEFQGRGYFIFRVYGAALGRLPKHAEFVPEMERIGGSQTTPQVEAGKEDFLKEWVERDEFRALYDGLSDAAYVDKMSAIAGVSLPGKEILVSELRSGRKNRAEVLRAIADSGEARQKFLNPAVVAMSYFAQLDRDPNAMEYQFWIEKLGATEDYRQVVSSLVTSDEYGQRFRSVY